MGPIESKSILNGGKLLSAFAFAIALTVACVEIKSKSLKVEVEVPEKVEKTKPTVRPIPHSAMPEHVSVKLLHPEHKGLWTIWYDEETKIFHEVCPNGDYLQYTKDNPTGICLL